jgi:hypothetical protein
MINSETTGIDTIFISGYNIYKAYCGDDVIWEKSTTVFDNDNVEYKVKNYITAKGYSSFATTPLTGASTDVIELGFTITTRVSTNYCWLIGYYVNESDRFGIYPRTGSANTFTIDFWRGSNSTSRKTTSLVSTTKKRFNLVVGNPTSTATNRGYAYDTESKTTLVASSNIVNTTTSSAKYVVSENRSSKANNVVNYDYIKIYKRVSDVKTLSLYWIPVQRVSDDVWGFYDVITKNFYPSEGSAQFTGG